MENDPPAALKHKIALGLALITAAIYLPTASYEFVNFDDSLYVTEQPIVQKGLTWEGFKWAFTNFDAANWHPLTWLSHMLDCSLFGLDPAGPHLMNGLLHALNAALLFLILNRMTRRVWLSAIVAGLFAWHPLRVESVAWIAERKDALSVFFGLLAIAAYARHAEQRESEAGGTKVWNVITSRWHGLTFVALAASLMSKATFVTLPFALLLLDFWPLKRAPLADTAAWKTLLPQLCRLTLEKLPLLTLALAVSIVTLRAQRDFGAVVSLESLPIDVRAGNALAACIGYLKNTFLPFKLALFYPHPHHVPFLKIAGSAAALILITAMSARSLRSRPYLAVGWFWFLGTLTPVIGIVQVGRQAMADRYTYIPHIGLFIAVVWGAAEWLRRRNQLAAGAYGAIAALIICAGLSLRQSVYWKNSVNLFERSLAVTANNALAHNNLGAAYAVEGRFAEAIEQYREAVSIWPGYAKAHHNLGTEYSKQGLSDKAINHLRESIRLDGRHADAHYNLGIELSRRGQWDEAAVRFRSTIELQPNNAKAHGDLGVTFAQRGDTAEALRSFKRAVELDPGDIHARQNLATALAAGGNFSGAVEQMQIAIAAKPESPALVDQLGAILQQSGKTNEARAHFHQAAKIRSGKVAELAQSAHAMAEEGRLTEAAAGFVDALKLQPDNPELRNTYATVLARQGDFEAAIVQFSRVIESRPDYAKAHYNRAMALEELGDFENALSGYRRASELNPEWTEPRRRILDLMKTKPAEKPQL